MKMQHLFRRVISVVIVLLLVFSLAAPSVSAVGKTVTIGSVDISKFTIVYPTSDYYSMAIKHPDTFSVGEWDFGRLIAERLRDEIASLTGYTLPLAEGSSSSSYVINITTNGDSGKTGAYSVTGSGTKLTLFGDSYGAAYHSIDYLVDYINSKGSAVDLGSVSLSGTHKMYTITCYGDSITAGAAGWEDGQYVGYPRTNRSAYPSVLGRLLWKDAIVLNYGLNSVSVSTAGQAAYYGYNGAKNYEPMLSQAPNSDLTIIMLGTNDVWGWSSGNGYGSDAVKAQYLKDYTNMVNSILAKNPNMSFMIASVPALNVSSYKEYQNISAEEIRELQQQVANDLIAKGVDAVYADVGAYTAANCSSADYSDSCHFNNIGYAKLAAGFQDFVLDFNPNLTPSDTDIPGSPDQPGTPVAATTWTVNMTWADSEDVVPKGTAITVYNRYPEIDYASDAAWADYQGQRLNFTRGSVSTGTYRSPIAVDETDSSSAWDVNGTRGTDANPVWIVSEDGYQISVVSWDVSAKVLNLSVSATNTSSGTVSNTMTKENAQTIVASASDGSFNTYTATIVNNTGAAFAEDLTFWFTPPSGWPAALYGENQKITFSQNGEAVPFYAHQYVAGYLKTGGWGGSWNSNATELGYTFTVAATNDPNYAGNSTMTITVSGTAQIPDETDPEETEPTVTEPVVTEPVVTEPVVTEPVATEPVVTEPVATEPVATEPVVTEPVATEPVVTEPVATEPVVTEPVATEPVVTEPVATEPVVTAPEATTPEVTNPETTEPEVTDPEAEYAPDCADPGLDCTTGRCNYCNKAHKAYPKTTHHWVAGCEFYAHPVLTDNGDGTHTVTRHCEFCDETVVEEPAAHSLKDGVCGCGYTENAPTDNDPGNNGPADTNDTTPLIVMVVVVVLAAAALAVTLVGKKKFF